MNKLIKTLSFLLFLIPIAAYGMNPTSLDELRRTGKEQSVSIDREGQELLDRLDKLQEKIQADIKYSAIDERIKQIKERYEAKKQIKELSPSENDILIKAQELIEKTKELHERKRASQTKNFKPSNNNSLIVDRGPMPIDYFMSDTESVLAGPRSGSELISPFHPENNLASNFFISDASDMEASDKEAMLEEISGSDWDSDALENIHDKVTIKELLKDPMYRDMSVNMDKNPEKPIIRKWPLFILLTSVVMSSNYFFDIQSSYDDVIWM